MDIKGLINLDPHTLRLSDLPEAVTSEMIEASLQAITQEQAVFKARYGKNWKDKWLESKNSVNRYGYDVRLRAYNNAIYTGMLGVSGTPAAVLDEHARYEQRCRELYGEQFDELFYHKPGDPRVVELLLADAIKTGKWKELPDELQAEYHARVSGKV